MLHRHARRETKKHSAEIQATPATPEQLELLARSAQNVYRGAYWGHQYKNWEAVTQFGKAILIERKQRMRSIIVALDDNNSWNISLQKRLMNTEDPQYDYTEIWFVESRVVTDGTGIQKTVLCKQTGRNSTGPGEQVLQETQQELPPLTGIQCTQLTELLDDITHNVPQHT